MQRIIDETERSAYMFLNEFGFGEQEIAPVIAKGLFDLETTLNKLKQIIGTSGKHDTEEIDDTLHALKGLLFQLGNHELAEKIEALRGCEDSSEQCEALYRLLF